MVLKGGKVHIDHFSHQVRENVVRTKFLRLSILSLDGSTRDKILDLLKVDFFLLFFFIISLVFHKLVEKDL